MHGGLWLGRGSRRRTARIRLRGNWPPPGSVIALILALLFGVVMAWLHLQFHETGQ